jgi:ADP-heptose:LPS heptosyltransferase
MAGFPILYVAEADPTEAVLSSGALAHVVEAMPGARVTVVGSPLSAPLFADLPGLERLLVLEREKRLDWLRLWAQIRDRRWGLVVDMRGTTLSARLKRQKRAVRVNPEPGEHAAAVAARTLQLDETPRPRLFLGEETRAAADVLLAKGEGPILAVAPTGDWIGKVWPADRYVKVVTRLLADDGPLAGGRLLIVGDDLDGETRTALRMAAPLKRTLETRHLSRLQTCAALSRAALVLGGDSLWTQLAVAAGAPVVAVFGPSDDAVRGPFGEVVVRGPRTMDEYRVIDPRLDQAIQHLLDLPADRVFKAAVKRLERAR